ncbi:helix-turn-helix domain-containing protein [Pseudomonas sp.]|uniref:helix-turn-helix domain-containing protein n=1 Tax=Pseudomonas sp. TaxID=306 RepID=UPI003C77DC38
MFLIRSGALDGFERLLGQLGQNPAELLRQHGFSSAQLREPNSYLSYLKLADLLDDCALLCHEPLFGLRLAAGQSLLAIGEMALPGSQQPSLGEALEFAKRYLHLHAQGVNLQGTLVSADYELSLSFAFSNASGLWQLNQLGVGQLFNALGFLTGSTSRQLRLHLQQARPSDCAWLADWQAGRLVFDSPINGVSFPADWRERPPSRDEALTREYFQQRMQMLAARYPDQLQDQVCHVISSLLPAGEGSVERVGAALGLHPRTLQKRLQQEGSSFSQLLQKTRLGIARQHLQQQKMSITDLALNLGYAEVAVFSRHFKRWTGLSPRQWRAQQAIRPER